jgi:hypothetical protein
MNNETQQTAVEWLIQHIRQDVFVHSKSTKEWNQVFQQAKEMEKEQIIKAASDHCYPTCELATIDAEEYYKLTYGGNK